MRFALVGPGRAGTALSEGLARAGWQATAVAGRRPDAPSVLSFAARFGADIRPLTDVGRGASVVVVATPDVAVEEVAVSLAPSLDAGALVVHLAGSFGADGLGALSARRPDVRVAAVHPLQTLAGTPEDADRLAGTWFAIDGDDGGAEIVAALGGQAFRVADRVAYHAAAAVAANHLVALTAQVERLAAEAGVPAAAFGPLMETALRNALAFGSAAALTGPVARGDVDTVARHLDRLPADELPAYRAMALEALRVSGRADSRLETLLAGVLTGDPS